MKEYKDRVTLSDGHEAIQLLHDYAIWNWHDNSKHNGPLTPEEPKCEGCKMSDRVEAFMKRLTDGQWQPPKWELTK